MQLLSRLIVFRVQSNINIMKKVTVIGIALAIATTVFAQDREYQTLVDFDEVRVSGLGGPFMQFTTINGEFAHMMGGGGAILLNNFWIGAYGMGLTNNIPTGNTINYNEGDSFSISHGGFWLGYSLFGDRAIHVSISTLLGWGEIGIKDQWDPIPDPIFVIVPTLELELNLTRYFRLGAGATYNIFTFVDQGPDFTASDFSSPGGFLSFKFGWF